MQKIRVAAIIIKGKKILFVKGSDKYKEYWTPGGKLEEGETELECLKRELKEELNVKFTSAKFYKEYISESFYKKGLILLNKVYIVNIKGELKPGKEVKSYFWISKPEFIKKKSFFIPVTRDNIIPDLISDRYY